MKLTLESTDRLTVLVIDGCEVPARVWQGETASGIPCHAYITRVCVHKDEDSEQFQRKLDECVDLQPGLADAIPLRMFIG